MSKNLLAALAALALTSCYQPGEQQSYTPNGYKIEKLFTHEGCSVYRFFDSTRPVYYVTCANGTEGRVQYDAAKQPTFQSITIRKRPIHG